jgi:DNA-binding transcriptional MerR regulator
MDEKRYTSGELAAAAGLSVRAVQHYDNIGLLPSSGRTEGGRRYYIQDDLIRLEQIVFYKMLNFSLAQIKDQLLMQPNTVELLEMFKTQQLLILQKIEQLHTSFATIGVMSRIVEIGKEPPFHILLSFLNALPMNDIFAKAPNMLTAEQHEALSPYFQDIDKIQSFYHKWKEISIEATVLLYDGISPEDQLAQNLAKRWWDMFFDLTGGNLDLLEQLSTLTLSSQLLDKNKEMMEATNIYIQKASSIYAENNKLPLKIK